MRTTRRKHFGCNTIVLFYSKCRRSFLTPLDFLPSPQHLGRSRAGKSWIRKCIDALLRIKFGLVPFLWIIFQDSFSDDLVGTTDTNTFLN